MLNGGETMTFNSRLQDSPRSRGYTLIELMLVVTIMAVLIAVPAPMFARAVEQPKLDVATANLRSIWAAERFYFLENGRYGSLSDLMADTLAHDLIDPTILSGSTFYSYTVVPSLDGLSFVATATRPSSPQCYGTVTIKEKGDLDCEVFYMSQKMKPSMEPLP
jgi:prepilin-type N-terminal cleavage/methylation domain-containing protein